MRAPGRARRLAFVVLLPALLAGGGILRFWRLGESALSMWDEAAYVQAGRWLATMAEAGRPHAPNVAPPLFAAWLGLAFAVAGFRDTVAIGASAVSSTASLGALYLLGRRLIGAEGALVAVAFLAANLYHVIFARQAITDATFLLFLILSIHAILAFAHEGGRLRGLWSGVALGLAQNTKYHGFFAAIIAAPAGLAHVPRAAVPWSLFTRRYATTLLLALLAFVPWLVAVTVHYGGVGWLIQHYALYAAGHASRTGTPWLALRYLTLWCAPLMLICAACGLWLALRERRGSDLVLLSWLGLFVAGFSLYTPYPRLLLPVTACLALLAGRAAARWLEWSGRRWLVAAACAAAFAAGLAHAWGRLGPWGEGYRAAGWVLASLPPSAPCAALAQPVLQHYAGRDLPYLTDPDTLGRLRAGGPLWFVLDFTAEGHPASALVERNAGRFVVENVFENPVSETDLATAVGLERFLEYRRHPLDPRWRALRTVRVCRVTGPWAVPEAETIRPTGPGRRPGR